MTTTLSTGTLAFILGVLVILALAVTGHPLAAVLALPLLGTAVSACTAQPVAAPIEGAQP